MASRRSRASRPACCAEPGLEDAGQAFGILGRMSQEDLDRVRDAWQAVSAGDFDRFIEAIDPEVEFTSLIAEAEAVPYCGYAGVRRWWDSMHEAFEDFWAESIEVREVGDRILAHIRLCGTVQDTKVEQPIWQVLKVRDGRTVGWQVYRTEAEALAAIRSEEQARSASA
jgi:hypothetical protein